MYGFEHNEVDPHNAIPARTLKVLLRTNLENLLPAFTRRIKEVFAREVDSKSSVDSSKFPYIIVKSHFLKSAKTDWVSVSAFGLARAITGQINNQILVGEELSKSIY